MPDLATDQDIKRSARAAFDARAAERSLASWRWCDRHLIIPTGEGPRRYDSTLTPYWRYWLEILQGRIDGIEHHPGAHLVEQAYIVSANQVGKTLGLLLAVLEWAAAVHPRDAGLVLDSIKNIRKCIRGRLRPTFDASPRLRQLMPKGAAELRERMGMQLWELIESLVYFLDGCTAKDLRSIPLPLLLLDEFDVLPADVQGEGDPIRLALDRQKTFPLIRLLLAITTPTTVDGHGWYRLCRGTHERLVVRCLECPAHWWLDPDFLSAAGEGLTAEEIRETDGARLVCPRCGRGHTTAERDHLVLRACEPTRWTELGGWVPGRWETEPDGGQKWTPSADVDDTTGRYREVETPRGAVRSGWINSLYSPFVATGTFLAEQMLAKSGSLEEWLTFRNGWRAEPTGDAAQAIEAETIKVVVSDDQTYTMARCPYRGKTLVCTIDQQGIAWDRCWFPWVVRLWAEDGESWLVGAGGHDKESPCRGWDALAALLARRFDVGDEPMPVHFCTVDTANGPLTPQIRGWCGKQQPFRRSLSGSGTMRPDNPYSITRLTRQNAAKMQGLHQAYYYNSNFFRNELAAYMRGQRAPWHIPSDAPQWYRESLRSERQRTVTERRHGRLQTLTVWEPDVVTLPDGKTRERDDNHWWDVEVAQIAAVTIFGLLPDDRPQARRIVRRGIIR
jgi:hypothetical protein